MIYCEKLIEFIRPDFEISPSRVFNFTRIQQVTQIPTAALDEILREWLSDGYIGDVQFADNVPFDFKITPAGSRTLFH